MLSMKNTKLLCILITLFIIFIPCNANNNKKEILFISSYSPESYYLQNNISSLIDTFIDFNGDCDFSIEYLRCTTLNSKGTWITELKKILDKHPNSKLIVLAGSEAWASYLSLTEEKYRKTPLFLIMGQRYFTTFPDDDIPLIKNNDSRTIVDIQDKIEEFNVQQCYYYDYDVDRDIDLIKTLFPSTKNIAIISDNTFNGASHLRQVKNLLYKKYPQYNIIFIDGRYNTTEEAAYKINKLPKNSIALLCLWKYDKDEVAYLNNAKYSFQNANPTLPVFSLTGTGIGNWAIGGCIPDYHSIGEELAEKAYALLENNNYKGREFKGYKHILKVDMEALKRYNLLNATLPSDVVYINSSLTLEEYINVYKWYFIIGIIIIATLIISLITAIIANIKTRRLKSNLEIVDKQLRLEKEELIKYQEELIIAKEDAIKANNMKSKFVSNMSHEIRTPLNAIVGFSDFLVNSIEATEEQKEFIDIIKYNTDLLLKLINDILYLSRLEANKQQFNFEKCDIIPYINSSVTSVRPSAKEGVNIIFTPQFDKLEMKTDIVRLQQIIINLLNNAIKFTSEGYIDVSVDVNYENSIITFSVTDTGCGIPLEEQEKVFDRFNKLNEYVQGTGLGLSICQITVRRLGGNIYIDKNYTEGARFIFNLPIEYKEYDI